jgi:cyclopropane-fatty-acyl-phospholipid synthase
MLYKFKSKETSDLIMLAPHARLILKLIGKDQEPKGIVIPQEMPNAIERLKHAIEAEEIAAAQAKQVAKEQGKTQNEKSNVNRFEEDMPHISLKQRAVPFMEMLKRAHDANVEVVWGV